MGEAEGLTETDRRVPSCLDESHSSDKQAVPQYSTVTALVLRYSMRASSPVSQTKQNSVSQTLAALVTEEAKNKVFRDKSGSVIVVLVQNFSF